MTRGTQADEDTIPSIEAVNSRKDWIDSHAQLAYKYLIVVDGNGLAPRFKNALAANSVTLKQDSPYYEFWYATAD